MAKRFTDTEKWERPWFRKLPNEYKLLWNYICDKCDIAGIWYVDIEIPSFLINHDFDIEKARSLFSKQIQELEGGTRWLILDFADFQYGELRPTNNLHRSVMTRLSEVSSSGADQGQNSPSRGAKDKVMDKDKVKDNGRGMGKPERHADKFNFEVLWARYPRREGKKEALRHFTASVKTVQDWADIQNALDNYIKQLRQNRTTLEYTKMGSTWFNNWCDYVDYSVDASKVNRQPPPSPKPPEKPPRENTHEELLEMHMQTVSVLKRCPSGAGCELCKEIEQGQKVVSDAMATMAGGKTIEPSKLEAADVR